MKVKYFIVFLGCIVVNNGFSQSLNFETLKGKASWGMGGVDRVVFESHSLRQIARYDSFFSVVSHWLTDMKASELDFETLPTPLNLHYALFADGKRKLTIENPEFLPQSFDVEKETLNNQDSLPSNVIHIYDIRNQVNLSIYLEELKNVYKLKELVDFYYDSLVLFEGKKYREICGILGLKAIDEFKIYAVDFLSFKESLQTIVRPEKKPKWSRSYNFYSEERTALAQDSGYKMLNKLVWESNFQPVFWPHTSLGVIGENPCIQVNFDLVLASYFEQDLPKELIYLSGGTTLYNYKDNSDKYQITNLYELLVGLKITNIHPHLKSINQFWVSGLEVGRYMADPLGSILNSPGYVVKGYNQRGNVRINTGFYFTTSTKTNPNISQALMFSIEIFDIVGMISKKNMVRQGGKD
ncbi:MAG: hypothetical protein NBV77_00080 [Bacteroidia bacterium]|nr:hypothetical protein [Bacteroidia bacterium]